MSFSMLFCIVFTMGAVFFDCKWEKIPNLWIIAGLQISMAEHPVRRGDTGAGSAVIRFWGGIFLVLFFFLCFWGNTRNWNISRCWRYSAARMELENIVLDRDGISSGCRGIPFSSFFSL